MWSRLASIHAYFHPFCEGLAAFRLVGLRLYTEAMFTIGLSATVREHYLGPLPQLDDQSYSQKNHSISLEQTHL